MDEAGVQAVIQNLSQFKADAAEMDKAIGTACDGMEKSVGSVSGKLEELGGKLTGIGKDLALKVTAPLLAVGGLALKTASDFEDAMARVALAAQGTGAPIEELRDLALDWGNKSLFSASQVASAMEAMLKEGRSWADIQKEMPGVIDLATASGLDLVDAVGLMDSAVDNFGYSLDQVNSIADAYVKSVNSSEMTTADLSESLQAIGPLAQGMGWSLEDVSVALGLLADRGIKGGDAGTMLRMVMLNLLRPSDEVKGALDQLNVELYDAQGNLKPLPNIVDELGRALGRGATYTAAMGGATKEMTAKYQDAVENIDAVRGRLTQLEGEWGPKGMTYQFLKDCQAQGILAENLVTSESRAIWDAGQKLDGYQRAITDYKTAQAGATTTTKTMSDEVRTQFMLTIAGARSQGALNILIDQGAEGWGELAGRMKEGASAQEAARIKSETFSAQVTILKNQLQTLLIDAGTPLLRDFLLPLVAYIKDLVGRFGRLDPQVSKVILVFGGLAAAAGPVLMILGTLITSVGTVIGAAGSLVGVIGTIASAIGAPILVPLAAIAAAIAVLYLAWTNNWGGIRDTVQEAVDNLREIFDDVVLYLQTYIPQALAVLQAGWNVVWPAIQSLLETVWGVIGPFIQSAVSNIVNIIGSAWAIIRDWTEKNWPLIQNTIATVMAAISVIIQTVSDAIKWVCDRWGKDLMSLVQSAWDIISTIINTALNVVLGLIETIMQIITGDWSGAWDTIKGVVQTVWDAILKIIGIAIDKIKEFGPRLLQAGRDIIEGLLNGIKEAGHRIADWIMGILGGMVDAIKRFFGIGSPSSLMMGFGQDVMLGFIAGIQSMRPALEAQMQATISPIVQAASAAAVPMMAGGGYTYSPQYNLSANYAQIQSAASIRDDLLAMEMLAGARR